MNNDKLIFDNYLMDLKSTVEVYVHGTLESSNEDTREILHNGLNETLKHQADAYEKMEEYGWYNSTNVKSSDVSKCLKNLEN